MSAYALGVDLGTTYTAAAVARQSTAEPLPLGTEAAQIPSVVLIREDGEVLVGDAAERRAAAEPTRAAREFKRRLGDPVPIVIGGQPVAVETLMGYLLAEVVRRATEQEGEPPSLVVLTHPANYSDYKTGLLRAAASAAGLADDQVELITEPEAAAIAYSRQARIDTGEVVAVYDFGGGTFDAALVRRGTDRFELIGVPEGMERLGGIDFDQAVLAHVDSTLDGLVAGADRNDPQTRPAQARLRVDCRRAKEALSTDSDTTIPVAVPGVNTEVRLTRDEFESMVRPRVGETVRALERAIASAQIDIDDVSRILLVGGTSRMPIVAEMVRSATGRPVALDAHPKLAIAVGAALSGASSVGATTPARTDTTEWQAPARVAETPPAATAPKPSGRRKGLIFALAGGGIGVAAVVAAVTLGGGSSPSGTPATDGAAGTAQVVATTDTASAGSTAGATPTAPPVTEPTSTGSTSPGTTSPGTAPVPTPNRRGVAAIVTALPTGDAVVTDVRALAVDQTGAVYVASADATVVRIAAGEASVVFPADPTVGAPGGLVIGLDGSVLMSTPAGVRSISAGGSTLLLDAAASGLGTTPGPLALDGVGNLYLADNDTHRIIRRGVDGSLSLIAGSGAAAEPGPPTGDGQPAGSVALGTVTGLAIDASGNLVFADSTSSAVRQVASDGTLSTLAGGGGTPVAGGDGSWVADGAAASDVAFLTLDGLTIDPANRIYVTDATSGAIVRIAGGAIELVIVRQADVTAADGVPARDSAITAIGALAIDRSGNLYFGDGAGVRSIGGP